MRKLIFLFFIALFIACSGDDDNNQTAIVEDILTGIDAPNIIAEIISTNGLTVQISSERISCGYLSTIDGVFYCTSINAPITCIIAGWFITTDMTNAIDYPNLISFSSDNRTINVAWGDNNFDIPVGATWEGFIIPQGLFEACGPGHGERQFSFQENDTYYVRFFLSTDFATTYSKPIVLNLN